jgi:hypothetical protein
VPQDGRGADRWLKGHDDIEEKIGHLEAETLGDVLIKLGILCDRLQQASVCTGDLSLAKSASKDLTRLSFNYEN